MLTKLTLYVDTILFAVLLLCDYVYTYVFRYVTMPRHSFCWLRYRYVYFFKSSKI